MNAAAELPFVEIRHEPQAKPTPFENLVPFLDGTHEPIRATIAEIWPERCLLYAQAVNEIHAEPSVGKTNILLAAAKEVLKAGGQVCYLDPEDTAGRIVARALSLGLDPEAMRERFHYCQDPSAETYEALHTWAREAKPALVILDGLAEALAAEGKDENAPLDILGFFRERIRPFASAGAAVVIADHVVKSAESRGRWARGSGAKLGHYNGVSYEIALGQAYTPTQPGFVKLKVSKDRNGAIGTMGQAVAELHFEPQGGGKTLAQWQEPAAPEAFRLTAIMAKVAKHLETFGEASKTDLRGLGKGEYVDKAISLLLEDGQIQRETIGQRHRFTLANEGQKQ